MAEKNSTRKAPSGNDAANGTGVGEVSSVAGVLQESRKNKNGKGWTIKLKAAGPKQTKPGNWKDAEINDGKNESKDDIAAKIGSPLTSSVDDKTAAAFPSSKPLEDRADLVQCKQCKRPVLRHVAKEHIKECQRKKQEKIQKKKEAKEAKELAARREKGLDDDDERPKGARTASFRMDDDEDGNSAAKKTKKRKAEDALDQGKNAKKKKKDEPKTKVPKTKGPVDVEKQCGVPLPNGAQCARSLTCKSHSMGAKRAVPGRSLPYDMLLAQYQKKNQAKQMRTAIDANVPLADDFDNHGPVDSEEERDAVMAAVQRANPQPLFSKSFTSTRSKYQYVRLKEVLQNALSGSQGARLFATAASQNADTGQRGLFTSSAESFGRSGSLGAYGEGVDGSSHSRRSSVALSAGGPRPAIQGSMGAPAARKPSISGASVASAT